MTGKTRTILAATCLAVITTGCATTREVITPANRDTLNGAPGWAVGGGQTNQDRKDTIFFVGVSTEQALSEGEAIELAYRDALRQAGDYVGVSIESTDEFGDSFVDSASADWPFRSRSGWGRKKELTFQRGINQGTRHTGSLKLIREQLVSTAHVVDSWATAERFAARKNHPGILVTPPEPRQTGRPEGSSNWMEYGEVWKAKVLVAASRSVLDDIRITHDEREERGYEFAWERKRTIFEKEVAHSDLDLRRDTIAVDQQEAMNALDRKEREGLIEADLQYREKATDVLFDKPTFHFMNNTLWYGRGVPRTNIRP